MAAASLTLQNNNLESFSLIWVDALVNNSKENLDAQRQLRTSTNHLKTFEQSQECEQYIQSVLKDDRIVLISSGRTGRELVPSIHQLRQVSSIYVYCMDKKRHEEWANQFKKVKGVFTQLNELVTQIQSDQKKRNHNKVDESISFNISCSNNSYEQSTTGLNGQFLHSQLLIDCLLRMKSTSRNNHEFISLCQNEYKDNEIELAILREFEQNYSADSSLWWYTRQSFLYRILNKALRVQNIDLLFVFRFFIRDIERQLKVNKCSSPVHVYRGQLMCKGELQLLKDSVGEFISINSFLSTSLTRQQALSFLRDSDINDDFQQILFEIDADPQLNGVKPFADITEFSYFPSEQEVLMMPGSVFRLVDIYHDENQVWIIRMTLCSDDDHDLKSIFDHMKKKTTSKKETSLLSFCRVLLSMGKFDDAEKYYSRLLLELPHDHRHISTCYYNLGCVATAKGDYKSSLEWHQIALEIKMRTLKSDDPSIADSHTGIGEMYRKKGDLQLALKSFEKALTIDKQAYGEDHQNVAHCYNNIGMIYDEQEKSSEALEFYQKALTISQKSLPADHPDLAAAHHNIGILHSCRGQYDLALEHFNMSLQIKSKSLPSQHISIASTLECAGLVCETKSELQQALSYYKKAVTIRQHILPLGHPTIAEVEQMILRVSSALK